MKNKKDTVTGNESDVKDRIKRIMRAKNLNASQLAERMGIGNAVLSHIMSGRNEPSSSFFIKLKTIFPEYNLEWLMMGSLPVTSLNRNTDNSNFEYPKNLPEKSETELFRDSQTDIFQSKPEDEGPTDIKPLSVGLPEKKVVKLIVVYSDNTFEELQPSQP